MDLTKLRYAADEEEFIAGILSLPAGLAFRGHGDASFALVSSLRRRLAHLRPDERRRAEQRIVSAFVNALGDRLEASSMLGPVLALMQHHGAPTRLLDFSWSPLVAVYFATEGLSSADGRIIVADISALLRAWRDEATRLRRDPASYEILEDPSSLLERQEHNLSIQVSEAVGLPLPLVPSRASDRMRAQSGLFLVEPLSRDWEAGVQGAGLYDSVTIPSHWKRGLLGVAVRTNNSGGTLFPGLDGVGREIVEREVTGEFNPFV